MNSEERATRSAVAGAQQTEVAVLAGGCFWGVEEILRGVPGVIDTDVGYTGGWLENPTYDDTHDSKSGHAEAIRVTFDPSVLSYEDLLEQWFFRCTTRPRSTARATTSGPSTARRSFRRPPSSGARRSGSSRASQASGKWKRPITTTIEPASTWYSAEAYHQDYLRKHPGGYSCHYMRD